MTKRRWPVVVAPAADADFDGILRWTAERFGAEQARSYAGALSAAINALSEGPGVAEAKATADIGLGFFVLHVARAGRKGRHFVVFRIGPKTTAMT